MKNFKLFVSVLLLVGNSAQAQYYSSWSGYSDSTRMTSSRALINKMNRDREERKRLGIKAPCEGTDSISKQKCAMIKQYLKDHKEEIAELKAYQKKNLQEAIDNAPDEETRKAMIARAKEVQSRK